jgi:F-type H+-transporting ATPase subunit a
MPAEHELWLTALLNKLIGGPLALLLIKLGFHPDTGHPIPNQIAMELLVIALILIGALILRPRLSVENPGKFQQMMEVVVEFTENMTDEMIGPGGRRYVTLIGTLGIFVALCNLLGLIPTLGTATASIDVTLGCALVCFLYYNYHGFRQHGIVGYLKHLCGPMMAIAVLMFPIEVFSNAFRLLSLSVRLWANMLVGDLLEGIFTGLIPIVVPALFMALHIFVSLLQAYVFMILPAVYISMAVEEEH